MADLGNVLHLVQLRFPSLLACHHIGGRGFGDAAQTHLCTRSLGGLGGGKGDLMIGAIGGIEDDGDTSLAHGGILLKIGCDVAPVTGCACGVI